MQVSGEYTFDAPQAIVWNALRDPDVLASIMPGGEGFAEVGENQYSGNLNVKVGPVQGKFQATILLSDIVEPDSYAITVDGKGPQGFVKANGRLHLTPQGQQTHMAYEGDAQIGGRIASVGQRLLDSSAKSIIRQSLEGLNQYVKFQAANAPPAADTEVVAAEVVAAAIPAEETTADLTMPEATPLDKPLETMAAPEVSKPKPVVIPGYKPPSQTNVALNVAKDVAGDLVPPQYRPVVIGIVVLLVLVLMVLIYRALT